MAGLLKFDWNWYHENLIRSVQNAEPSCQHLLDLIEEFDSIVRGLTERDMSIDSDHPQDYVVPVLVVRSYRLAISAIWKALSGFPDSVPNLTRPIFEIGIRLLDMTDDPVAASLGYLMQGAQEGVSTMQEELNFRRENGNEYGNLEKNLDTMKQYLDTLSGIAARLGYNPEEVRKRHGKLNFRDICKRFGIEKAYLVDYVFGTSHVHEKHAAYPSYSFDKNGKRFFNLGIVEEGIPHAVADSLINMSRVLVFSSRLLEDESLIKKSEALAKSEDSNRLYFE